MASATTKTILFMGALFPGDPRSVRRPGRARVRGILGCVLAEPAPCRPPRRLGAFAPRAPRSLRLPLRRLLALLALCCFVSRAAAAPPADAGPGERIRLAESP